MKIISSVALELASFLQKKDSVIYTEAVAQMYSAKNKVAGRPPSSGNDHFADLSPATLLKKRIWHRWFPVNFLKLLRTPFFIEHLWYGCSNVAKPWSNSMAKLSLNKNIFLRKKYVWFLQNLFVFKKSYLLKINICIPFKKFNSVKKKSLCKKIHFLKKKHILWNISFNFNLVLQRMNRFKW